MEGQERACSSTVRFKNENQCPSVKTSEKIRKTVPERPKCWCGRMHQISRPLRGVELLILMGLLALSIFMAVERHNELLTDGAVIVLITLFATYLFILSIDTISQVAGRTLPDAPMFLFVVIGFLMFAAAAEGVYILLYLAHPDVLLLSVMILCIIEAVLFLLDITLMILSWRQSCMRVDECSFGPSANCNVTTIYKRSSDFSPRTVRVSDPVVYDDRIHNVTTSISDYERPSHPDLVNLHKFRKVGVGHRRQYVDCPVDAPSSVCVRMIEVQTEPPQQKMVSDVESLVMADMKEEPSQTMPKCPMCANNWDPGHGIRDRPDAFGMCPTFLHLAQGFGMCSCNSAPSPTVRAIQPSSRTESTSATDLCPPRTVCRKPSSKRHYQDPK